MPVVSRFFGIVVYMNYNYHNPPHFHARCQDQEVIVEIRSGVVAGTMSRRALQTLFEWMEVHREELMLNWSRARERKSLLSRDGTMFLHVLRVQPLPGFRLRAEFNDGVVKEIDLSRELHGGVFEPLRHPELFRRGEVNPETGTVEWPNGADFAPEFLYEIGVEVQRVA